MPAVVTLTAFVPDVTLDKVPFPDACRKLELAGAAVVGLNCTRGPKTMIPLLKEIRKVCQVKVVFVNDYKYISHTTIMFSIRICQQS